MAKTLLIDTSPIPGNPTTSHCRTIQVIAHELGLELISTSEELEGKNPSDYSKFAIMGSAFYPKTAEIEAFIRRAGKPEIIWLNNEHTCSPNSEYARLIKDYDSMVISNVVEEGNKAKGYNRFELLNLNCLLARPSNPQTEKRHRFLYYGTYRPGRRIYFQKYFADRDGFILSSKTKNLRKFNQLAGCNCRFADSPDWTPGQESFNLVKYTIYLEDELMHKNFNHLSNRFYEALFCNVIQFFDESCLYTIARHKLYHIPTFFIVRNKAELLDKMQYLDSYQKARDDMNLLIAAWNTIALKEKDQVLNQLKELL